MAADIENFNLAIAACGTIGFAEFHLKRQQNIIVQSALLDQQRQQFDRLAALEDQLWVGTSLISSSQIVIS